MLPSQVIEMLDQLTALQSATKNKELLDLYRLGYYKTWLYYVIAMEPSQQQILKDLLKKEQESANVQ